MRNRSRRSRTSNDEKESCPVCGVSVKSRNLSGHLNRVHPDVSEDDLDNRGKRYEERTAPGQNRKADRRMRIRKEQRRKQDMMFVIFIIIFAVVGIGGYYLYDNFSDSGESTEEDITPEPAKPAPKPTADNDIRIPISEVNDGTAHFYTYNSNGVSVRYFVLKSSDGVIRAAFDTCDVCYDAKKGYRQEGDEMVCNNCNNRFASVKINEEKGGCNPAPLTRTIDGDDLVIKTTDIDAGRWYFQ